MANVSFKRGLSNALNSVGFAAQDGVFYLTTDTHRLYVGQDSNLVELNRYVKYVNTINDFPRNAADGDFAFASATNTLAVCKAGVWTQINAPDGNDDTKVTNIDGMKVSATDDGVKVHFEIVQKTTDSHGTTTDLDNIPVEFTISNADLATANKVAVGLGANNTAAGAEIATSGAGANAAAKVAIKSGDNITVSADAANNITISAVDTTYDLGATAADGITLTANGTVQNVPVKAGAKMNVAIADNAITISHAGLAAPTHTDNTAEAKKVSLADNGSFDAITAITAADGHITGYTTQKYQLPKGTTYQLDPIDGGIIRLKDNGDTEYDVTIAAGKDAVVSTDTAARSISVAHKTYSTSEKASVNGDVSLNPDENSTFTVVDGLKTTNGHVEEIYTKTVDLSNKFQSKIAKGTLDANNNGDITFNLKDYNGSEIIALDAPAALYLTVNGKKVYNQGSIDFYTEEEIDAKLRGINAMVYRGTVGTTEQPALPTTNVSIGDTYMVATKKTYHDEGVVCDVGDLLIATGAEGNDGYITGKITWTYVPSGDDTDTHYTLKVSDGKIALCDTTQADTPTEVASATIAAGTNIGVSTAGDVITVAHEAIKTTNTGAPSIANKTPDVGGTIDVVSAVTVENGHVTNITTDKVKLPTPTDSEGSLELVDDHGLNYTTKSGVDQTISFANTDGYITLSDDLVGQKMTLGHKVYTGTGVVAGDAITPNASRQFNVVSGVTRDNGGHVSSVAVSTVTLPADNDTTYNLEVDTAANAIKLAGSDKNDTSVAVKAGTATTVASDANSVTISHANVAHSENTHTAEPSVAGGTFTAINSMTVNGQGHVTAYNTETYTLPTDSVFELSGSVAAITNGARFVSSLSNTTTSDDAGTAEMSITSTSLKVVAANAGAVAIDLEWGAF